MNALPPLSSIRHRSTFVTSRRPLLIMESQRRKAGNIGASSASPIIKSTREAREEVAKLDNIVIIPAIYLMASNDFSIGFIQQSLTAGIKPEQVVQGITPLLFLRYNNSNKILQGLQLPRSKQKEIDNRTVQTALVGALQTKQALLEEYNNRVLTKTLGQISINEVFEAEENRTPQNLTIVNDITLGQSLRRIKQDIEQATNKKEIIRASILALNAQLLRHEITVHKVLEHSSNYFNTPTFQGDMLTQFTEAKRLDPQNFSSNDSSFFNQQAVALNNEVIVPILNYLNHFELSGLSYLLHGDKKAKGEVAALETVLDRLQRSHLMRDVSINFMQHLLSALTTYKVR